MTIPTTRTTDVALDGIHVVMGEAHLTALYGGPERLAEARRGRAAQARDGRAALHVDVPTAVVRRLTLHSAQGGGELADLPEYLHGADVDDLCRRHADAGGDELDVLDVLVDLICEATLYAEFHVVWPTDGADADADEQAARRVAASAALLGGMDHGREQIYDALTADAAAHLRDQATGGAVAGRAGDLVDEAARRITVTWLPQPAPTGPAQTAIDTGKEAGA